jgi:trigger factor
MEVTIKSLPETSQMELVITVPKESFLPYVEKAARGLSKDHPIKGFRPGKVPLQVAQEHYGTDFILQKAVDKAVPHFFVEAVMEHNIEAINRPSIAIESLGMEEGLRFKAVVDVIPEVKLPEISSVKVEKREVTMKDEEVDKELNLLAKHRATYQEVLRAAETGDKVIVDFEVSIDGQPIEGGTSKEHPITLGEGRFLPDFEAGLAGIAPGEERTFSMKFPTDYPQEAVAGKEASVRAKASSVQEQLIPVINDEFAQKVGKFETLDHLKKQMKEGILAEKEQKEKERHQAELAEKLAEGATFTHIPEILIEQEISQRIEEFASMLSYQQKTIEDYLQQQKKTIQDMRADMREAAVRNVKIGLAMRAFAKAQKIEPSEEDITAEINRYLQRYASTKQAESQIDIDRLREEVVSSLRNRQSLAKLEEIAGK